ncbi:tetratricopeptide repeat protein [Oricola sp.]|uniref:tetratricopeptide repeat protein n=1 Tax=Oricola sp. TaxID=1979950 RepID=UPI003BA8753E
MQKFTKSLSKWIAGIAVISVLAGCQTAGIDTQTTSAYKSSRTDKKLALAEKHFLAGNYGLAEKNYRLAVEAAPENGTAWLGLAASYDQLGRFDLSDRAYGQLIQLAGRRASILNNQGYSHYLRGDIEGARKILGEAKTLAPDSVIIEGNWKLAAAG